MIHSSPFDTFDALAAGSELEPDAASALQERGFVVIRGPIAPDRMERLAAVYDAAAAAVSEEVRVGSSSTRVNDFVNWGAEFDDLWTFPSLLDACCRVIGGPFKLSSLHARTVRPHGRADLHVDVKRGTADWPLLGFILMVDDFRPDNGATRFMPGSHRWSMTPTDAISNSQIDVDGQVLACGNAGSLVVFNGSTWHGYSVNTSSMPRRSIQGAFIPRTGCSGVDFGGQLQPDVRARLSPLARHVLALDA